MGEKSVLWISDQVRTNKPVHTQKKKLEAWNFRLKKKRDCTIPEAKTIVADQLCSFCTF